MQQVWSTGAHQGTAPRKDKPLFSFLPSIGHKILSERHENLSGNLLKIGFAVVKGGLVIENFVT